MARLPGKAFSADAHVWAVWRGCQGGLLAPMAMSGLKGEKCIKVSVGGAVQGV